MLTAVLTIRGFDTVGSACATGSAIGRASEGKENSTLPPTGRVFSSHHHPCHSGTSAPGSARRVDGDEVPGDRIENGHGQSSLVQAQGQRRACGFNQVRLEL